MKVILKQTKDAGLLIPPEYLPEGDEFEVELSENVLQIRPKTNGRKLRKKTWLDDLIGIAETRDPSDEDVLRQSESARFSFVGIAQSDNPNASVEVEEILSAEIDPRSGLTHKK